MSLFEAMKYADNRFEGKELEPEELNSSAKRTASPDIEKLEATLKRTQDFFFKTQHEKGYWVGELIVDATLISDMICYHYWNGGIDPEWKRKAINHIFSKQLSEGGWNIYPNGPSEINATIKAYTALKITGIPISDPRMQQARKVAIHLGGLPRINTFCKLNFALIGLFPWKYVPTIPSEIILIGKWFYVNLNEMSSWTRSMVVPLALINHYQPTRRPDPDFNVDELYPEGCLESDLALPRDQEKTFTWRNFFILLDHFLKFIEKARLRPFRKIALKKAEAWMLERLEGTDGLAAIFPAILNSLIALKTMGYPDDHPEVVRAEKELKALEHEEADSVRMEPCLSPVWDTAIAGFALAESGVSPEHPAMVKAMDFLLDNEIRFRGDWKHKNPVNVAPSGWVFEFNNKWNPDVDDTAMVLLALRRSPGSDRVRRDEAYQRGLKWLLTFQCKNGGWAAFDKDCTKGILEKVPFADHNAMLDPECADIAARILEVLGDENFSQDHPQVSKAIDFLWQTQEEDGSWYGRWGVNYIYGTWQVLRGLNALDVDMSLPQLMKSRDWLESIQLGDGGWGERCDTYDDPINKGKGPSTASQSAWALMGLIAFNDMDRPSIRRGVNYLMEQQNTDGTWDEDEITGTGFPKVFYLKYDLYRISWPLLALASYRNALTRRKIRSDEKIETVAVLTEK